MFPRVDLKVLKAKKILLLSGIELQIIESIVFVFSHNIALESKHTEGQCN